MHQEDVNQMVNGQSSDGKCETISTVTTPLTHREGKWGWVSELVSGIAAVFIILMKGLTVVCGLAVCVCLWLVGISVKP